MTLNRRRRIEVAKRYEVAAAKVNDAATHSDVAALSTFGTTFPSRDAEPDLDNAVGSLTGELVYLGYSFVEVHGEYVGPGHAEPIAETTVLVTQPFPDSSSTFQRDIRNLARKHRVDVVQVWDRETHRTSGQGPDDPIDGDPFDRVPAFTVDGARARAWGAYGLEHPESGYRERHSVLTGVSEGVGDVAAGTKLIRFALRRNEIFGEFY